MSKKFKRQNSHKHGRVPDSWRRPRGKHSPRRLGEAHAAPVPGVGHRGPADERGLHPSGLEEVRVHRPDDLDDVDADAQAVRIASGVGGRKREAILEQADEDGIHVLNGSIDAADDEDAESEEGGAE